MFEKFMPDHYFRDIYGISPSWLLSNGINLLVCDIDNTLVTYDDPEPTPPVREWFRRMSDAGIRVIFLSNNRGKRVSRFADSAGLPYYCNAMKPGRKKLLAALSDRNALPAGSAVLGDQIFTDILCGNRGGCATILVPPIKDRTDLFHRLKRAGERPIVRRFFRNIPNGAEEYAHWLSKTGRPERGDG